MLRDHSEFYVSWQPSIVKVVAVVTESQTKQVFFPVVGYELQQTNLNIFRHKLYFVFRRCLIINVSKMDYLTRNSAQNNNDNNNKGAYYSIFSELSHKHFRVT